MQLLCSVIAVAICPFCMLACKCMDMARCTRGGLGADLAGRAVVHLLLARGVLVCAFQACQQAALDEQAIA